MIKTNVFSKEDLKTNFIRTIRFNGGETIPLTYNATNYHSYKFNVGSFDNLNPTVKISFAVNEEETKMLENGIQQVVITAYLRQIVEVEEVSYYDENPTEQTVDKDCTIPFMNLVFKFKKERGLYIPLNEEMNENEDWFSKQIARAMNNCKKDISWWRISSFLSDEITLGNFEDIGSVQIETELEDYFLSFNLKEFFKTHQMFNFDKFLDRFLAIEVE